MAAGKIVPMPKKEYFLRSEKFVDLSEKLFGKRGASGEWMRKLHITPNVSPYEDFYARLAYVTGSVLPDYLHGIYNSPTVADREALRKIIRLQVQSLRLNTRFVGRVFSGKVRDERTVMRDYKAAITHLGSIISLLRTEPALKTAYSGYRIQHALGKGNLRSTYRFLLETDKVTKWREANR